MGVCNGRATCGFATLLLASMSRLACYLFHRNTEVFQSSVMGFCYFVASPMFVSVCQHCADRMGGLTDCTLHCSSASAQSLHACSASKVCAYFGPQVGPCREVDNLLCAMCAPAKHAGAETVEHMLFVLLQQLYGYNFAPALLPVPFVPSPKCMRML